MMLVAVLTVGVALGYLGSKRLSPRLFAGAERAMTLSVYAIILLVGVEGGRSLAQVSGSIWEFSSVTLGLLAASTLASLAVGLVLRRLGWLCS